MSQIVEMETFWAEMVHPLSLCSGSSKSSKKSKKGPNIAVRIFNHVLNQICQGQYMPGDRINEYQISKALKVSNIPVREAMERLISMGFARREPNKGIFMREISLKELEDVYQVRQDIETRLIHQVAARINDQQLAQLREVAGVLREPDDRIGLRTQELMIDDEFIFENTIFTSANKPCGENTDEAQLQFAPTTDAHFHMLLISLSGNSIYEKLAGYFLPYAVLAFRAFFIIWPTDPFKTELMKTIIGMVRKKFRQENKSIIPYSYISHEKIYRAIEARDADLAEDLMRQHLKHYFLINKAKIEVFNHLDAIRKSL
jgi:DNA-binding GntR family transcriptional regulator